MPEIVIEKLTFRYRNEEPGEAALRGVDLRIPDGEFLCVLGPSGCGKSTLLRLLAGLETPEEGTVRIGGETVAGPGADRMIVFQDYALFPWMTALGNVSFALRRGRHLPRREALRTARTYLELMGMSRAERQYPAQLSGGMCQRVAIARALAMDTEILLLDEPFGALDARCRRELQELLLALWQKGPVRKTVVFVTHDVTEALLLADRIVVMKPGRIRAELPVDTPRPRGELPALRECLLALLEEAGR